MANYNILTEVPPISKQDSFVVFERRKSNFNFPIHIHSEYELNYIIGARGARRIVGDHVADIGDREMVLITGSNLEHAWMDGNLAPGAEIYEVTIQFSPELFQGSGLIDRKQFAPIKKMLQDAQHGIAFSEKTILQSESGIHQLINSTDNFNSILIFLSLLNQLSWPTIRRIPCCRIRISANWRIPTTAGACGPLWNISTATTTVPCDSRRWRRWST